MPVKTKKQKPNPSTPSNDPNHFPGKPGPAPSGLKRKIQIPFMVTEEEFEYLRRAAHHWDQSVNELMRGRVLFNGWQTMLFKYRNDQGGNIP